MDIFKLKLYCGLLKIDYKEFKTMSIDRQIEFVNNTEIDPLSEFLNQTKNAFLDMLNEEKNEIIKFDKDIEMDLQLFRNKRKDNETER